VLTIQRASCQLYLSYNTLHYFAYIRIVFKRITYVAFCLFRTTHAPIHCSRSVSTYFLQDQYFHHHNHIHGREQSRKRRWDVCISPLYTYNIVVTGSVIQLTNFTTVLLFKMFTSPFYKVVKTWLRVSMVS
jgi:hypothetical protein